MKLIDRYIGKTVLGHTATVMTVLLVLYTFTTFVAEMDLVGRGTYTTAKAVEYTLMLLPRQAYELFPMVALLGSMLGLGALAGTSELTVVRAAGVSVRRIVGSVLKVGLVMTLAVIVVGEVIAPPLEKMARVEHAKALAKHITINTGDGLWVRDGREFVNIRRLLADGVATGITLYRFDERRRLQESWSAARGVYDGGSWTLENVYVTALRDGHAVTRVEKQLTWVSSLTPEVVEVVAVPPENLSIWDLYNFIIYLRNNGLESSRYEFSFWTRVVAPFATAAMVLLAVPFVFGTMRSSSIGNRILVGALLGIGFYMVNGIISRFGLVYNLPPVLAAVLPTATVMLLWLAMMRRVT